MASKNNLSFTFAVNRNAFRRYAIMLIFVIAFATPILNTAMTLLLMIAAFSMTLVHEPRLAKRDANRIMFALVMFAPAILIDFYWLTQYGTTSFAGLYIIIALLFSAIVARHLEERSAQLVYANVVTALALVSCILFSVTLIAPGLLRFAIQYEFYGYAGLTFGLQNFVIADGVVVFRNAGFASEPGTFQVFINIAVAILLRLKKMSAWRFVVLSAAIITANSTAGLATFGAILLLASNNRYRVITLIALVIGSNYFLSIALTHYNNKILTEYAFLGRFEPIINALYVFQQHPFGFGTVRYDQNLETLQIGSHDTYTQTLMRFGLFGFIFYMGSLVQLARTQLGIALAIALGSVTNNLLAIPPIAVFLFVRQERHLHDDAIQIAPRDKIT